MRERVDNVMFVFKYTISTSLKTDTVKEYILLDLSMLNTFIIH